MVFHFAYFRLLEKFINYFKMVFAVKVENSSQPHQNTCVYVVYVNGISSILRDVECIKIMIEIENCVFFCSSHKWMADHQAIAICLFNAASLILTLAFRIIIIINK